MKWHEYYGVLCLPPNQDKRHMVSHSISFRLLPKLTEMVKGPHKAEEIRMIVAFMATSGRDDEGRSFWKMVLSTDPESPLPEGVLPIKDKTITFSPDLVSEALPREMFKDEELPDRVLE